MSGIDLTEFYQAFFDEADELLADMERLLLELDVAQPDIEHLNAIFRAAHSIKGGAATFGTFGMLADTTHLLEGLLDSIRHREIPLRAEMIDVFLSAKDVLKRQVDAYRSSSEPEPAEFEDISAQLRKVAQTQPAAEAQAAADGKEPPAAPEPAALTPAPGAAPLAPSPGQIAAAKAPILRTRFERVEAKDVADLLNELDNLGQVLAHANEGQSLHALVETTCSAADIKAVAGFVINEDRIHVEAIETADATTTGPATETSAEASTGTSAGPATAPQPQASQSSPAATASPPATPHPAPASTPTQPPTAGATGSREPAAPKPAATAPDRESNSIRVGVEKVDQVINLVGELVITQAMLAQTASSLDPVVHDRLLNGLELLERNARALQESVMSIRMIPMEYVFSRFPRVVRDLAAMTGKKVQLETLGKATELDKSLIERIIDPLTHLIRNSLDHGIERPEERTAAGKNPEGRLTLSAQHLGGNIIIEVSDDGRGLDREKILDKAARSGIAIAETAADEEVWQLIFAPGFSTAEKVTSISGRGVGMDVVKRNIQNMGGHVQLLSRRGQGTTTRIVLPLTLAILDGMSVRVGKETFILPLGHVTESLQPQSDQIHSVAGGERLLHVRGEYLPLVEMHRAFSVEDAQTVPTQAIAVIMRAQDMRYALLVDHLIAQHQVVVKNLESNYRKVPGIAAATIMGDGNVALIVDVLALGKTGRDFRIQPQALQA